MGTADLCSTGSLGNCILYNKIYVGCLRVCISTQLRGVQSSMEDSTYDLVVLGAGSGGTRASRFASTLYGAKVTPCLVCSAAHLAHAQDLYLCVDLAGCLRGAALRIY
jgi:hypothetical protein